MSNIFDLFKKIETGNSDTSTAREPISYMIVGLGNPGAKYAFTRHNVGFMTIDYISQKNNVKVDRVKYKSLSGETTIMGKRVLLLKPQTFMNNSGEALRDAIDFYKISHQNMIVICDDISLDPGKIRIRRKGSDGGHNGLKSIVYHLGTDEFPRIKIGVGKKPHPDFDLADWVLSEFQEFDKKQLFSSIENVYNGIELILKGEIEKSMNLYN